MNDDVSRRVRNLRAGPGILVHNASEGIVISAKRHVRPGFLAHIVSQGPGGEEDYTDERYWVKEIVCNLQEGDLTSRLTFAEREARARWVTASNLAELTVDGSGTHNLADGVIVEVQPLYVLRGKHYVFFSRPIGIPEIIEAIGTTYIDSANPGVNFSGADPIYARANYPPGGPYTLTDKILIQFDPITLVGDELLLLCLQTGIWGDPIRHYSDLACAATDWGSTVRGRYIIVPWDYTTVTWNTEPADDGGNLFIFGLRCIVDNVFRNVDGGATYLATALGGGRTITGLKLEWTHGLGVPPAGRTFYDYLAMTRQPQIWRGGKLQMLWP